MQWVVDDEDNVLIPTHRRFVLGRSAEILYCFSKVIWFVDILILLIEKVKLIKTYLKFVKMLNWGNPMLSHIYIVLFFLQYNK